MILVSALIFIAMTGGHGARAQAADTGTQASRSGYSAAEAVGQNTQILSGTLTGSLVVKLSPRGAVAAGAQWRRAGTTAWIDSDTTETNVPAGYYNLDFKDVAGYYRPSISAIITENNTTKVYAPYTVYTGSLCVTIGPMLAQRAGAKWRRVGTTSWFYSGNTETYLPIGDCQVEFLPLGDVWITPTTQTATIKHMETSQVQARYGRDASGKSAYLDWSTYLGGSEPGHMLGYYSNGDYGYAVAVDGAGNIYAVGSSTASGWVSGGYDPNLSVGSSDAYVVKLSPAGEHLWSTFLGDVGPEYAFGVAVDNEGNAYVAGSTKASGWVHGGYNTTFQGGSDGFVVKLAPDGQHLWSTYLGGKNNDWCNGIAVDGEGNAIVAGGSYSAGWVAGGAEPVFHGTAGSTYDGFVVKLSSAGEHLWSSYLGGAGNDTCYGVAVDGGGDIVVTGSTSSAGWPDGGYNVTLQGGSDAFVAKLTGAGQPLWSTYLGGSKSENGFGVAVDGSGNIWASGWTQSPDWVSGGFNTDFGTDIAYRDYAVKLSGTGQHLWSTYLAGSGISSIANGIATDGQGNAYVTGKTTCSGWVSGDIDNIFRGYGSPPFYTGVGYAIKLSPGGQHAWSTYLGGTGPCEGTGIAVGGGGDIAVTGNTQSPGWAADGYNMWMSGICDAFVVKIHDNGRPGTTATLGVTLAPPEAVASGAQWRRAGMTAWLDSGTTEAGIPAGACVVEFKSAPGWATPAITTVTLSAGQKLGLTMTYVRGTALRVTLAPPEAVAAGARWRRVGSTRWLASGTTETGLMPAPCTVEFKPLAGWVPPANLALTLSAGQAAETSATYIRGASLLVNVQPTSLAGTSARWRRAGTTAWLTFGTTETELAAGPCDIECHSISAYAGPANFPVTLRAGELTSITATYTVRTGALQMILGPPEAVAAGAMWRRVGTTVWLGSGDSEPNLKAVTWTVEFKPVAGWITPVNCMVTVRGEQVTSGTATYGATGTLRVGIAPSEAAANGGQWRRVGTTTWRDSGTSETLVPAGSAVIELRPLASWTVPTTQSVAITMGQIADTTATYYGTGQLCVKVDPISLMAIGGKWRRCGTTVWQRSGVTEYYVPCGPQAVEFAAVAGWTSPTTQTVTILNGKVTSLTGFYLKNSCSLRVNLGPPEAVAAGAAWRIYNTAGWHASGELLGGLPPGTYLIELAPVAGWREPGVQTVVSGPDEAKEIGADYLPVPKNAIPVDHWRRY